MNPVISAFLKSEEDRSDVRADVNVVDSTLNVWFDHDEPEPAVVFLLFRAALQLRGFQLFPDPEPQQRRYEGRASRWWGIRGKLQVTLVLAGRHVETMFYREDPLPGMEPKARNRPDKLVRMPYLKRKQVELEVSKLVDLLHVTYPVRTLLAEPRVHPDASTAWEYITFRSRMSREYDPDKGYAVPRGDYNRRTADGVLLEQGMGVYFTDAKGRWLHGRAYYNVDRSWWVMTGRFHVVAKGCFELFAVPPGPIRLKNNHRFSLRRINALIMRAADAQQPGRMQELQSVRERCTAAYH